jgi:hypothetical protein
MGVYWASLKLYGKAVARAWWALFSSGVLAVVGGLGAIWHIDVKLGPWVWFTLAVVCLSVGQFLAFHQMRVERDVASAGRQTAERRPRQIGISMEGPGVTGNVFDDTHITFHGPAPEPPADEGNEKRKP